MKKSLHVNFPIRTPIFGLDMRFSPRRFWPLLGLLIITIGFVEKKAVAAGSAAPDAATISPSTDPIAVKKLAAAVPSFDITEYLIDGNSRLSDADIEIAVTPFLGESKTLREVEGARVALERSYHAAGFLTVVVSIPEQQVDSGLVALHVVEAGIERLSVKGAEYTLPSKIRARIPELAEGNVPNFPLMQKQLTALNRTADAKITPVLRAGKLPGTVEVQLDIDDQLPLHGSLEINNRQTPNTTAARLVGTIRYDNLWQLGHSASLTLQTAPQRTTDVRVAAGTYVLPVGGDGNAVTLSAVHSRSEFASLDNSPGLGLLGNSDIFGVRYSLLLPTTADFSQSFSTGADYKNVKQSVRVSGGASTDTPIRYVPLVATYSGNWIGLTRGSALDVNASTGLRGLLGNTDSAFEAKRTGASASFLALRTAFQHTENFARWALYGKLEMQLASGPLVPNEQFSVGGAESVRGYLEGERAGDEGVRMTAEVRTPQFMPGGVDSAWRLSGLLFADAARIVTRQPVSPQPAVHSLRGTGLGLRLAVPHGLMLELDAARALLNGDTTRAGDIRIHARSLWSF